MESTSTHQRPAMHTAEAHMRSALLPNCSNFIRSMHFARISNTRSSMASIFRCLLHDSSASLLFVFRATAVNWAVLAAFRPRRRSCSPLPLWILPVVLDLTASMNSGLFPVAAADRGHRLRAAVGRLLSCAGLTRPCRRPSQHAFIRIS